MRTKRLVDDALQLRDHALLDALVEERHVVGRARRARASKMYLSRRSASVGVVGQVGEGDLGLDHPELGEVAAGVGVLRAERGPEGVDLRQRQAVGLDVELAGDGEERLACRRSPARSRPCRRACAAGSRGRACETRNISPAPSASEAVMIGVFTQKKPSSWKKRWMAMASVWRTRRRGADHVGARRAGAPPRAGTPSCAAWAGSDRCRDRPPSRRPRSRSACISNGWPLRWRGHDGAGGLARSSRR